MHLDTHNSYSPELIFNCCVFFLRRKTVPRGLIIYCNRQSFLLTLLIQHQVKDNQLVHWRWNLKHFHQDQENCQIVESKHTNYCPDWFLLKTVCEYFQICLILFSKNIFHHSNAILQVSKNKWVWFYIAYLMEMFLKYILFVYYLLFCFVSNGFAHDGMTRHDGYSIFIWLLLICAHLCIILNLNDWVKMTQNIKNFCVSLYSKHIFKMCLTQTYD